MNGSNAASTTTKQNWASVAFIVSKKILLRLKMSHTDTQTHALAHIHAQQIAILLQAFARRGKRSKPETECSVAFDQTCPKRNRALSTTVLPERHPHPHPAPSPQKAESKRTSITLITACVRRETGVTITNGPTHPL